MSTPAEETKTERATPARARTTTSTPSRVAHELVTELGRTRIADTVVQKIAGIATREVPGVHELGGGAARAMGALRGAVGGRQSLVQGVSVEVGEKEAAVDLDIVVDYGVSINEVATQIRENVVGGIERMTQLDVTEVNISVNDLYLEGEEPEEPEAARVQ